MALSGCFLETDLEDILTCYGNNRDVCAGLAFLFTAWPIKDETIGWYNGSLREFVRSWVLATLRVKHNEQLTVRNMSNRSTRQWLQEEEQALGDWFRNKHNNYQYRAPFRIEGFKEITAAKKLYNQRGEPFWCSQSEASRFENWLPNPRFKQIADEVSAVCYGRSEWWQDPTANKYILQKMISIAGCPSDSPTYKELKDIMAWWRFSADPGKLRHMNRLTKRCRQCKKALKQERLDIGSKFCDGKDCFSDASEDENLKRRVVKISVGPRLKELSEQLGARRRDQSE